MKKRVMLVSALALVAGVWTATSRAVERGKPAATKTETYSVVQVGDEIKVVKKSEMMTFQKGLADAYKQEMKTYNEAKKEASKKKEKLDMPKPVKPTVKTLKPSLKSQQEAEDWCEKFVQKKEETKAGK
jgi:hypothetical protein